MVCLCFVLLERFVTSFCCRCASQRNLLGRRAQRLKRCRGARAAWSFPAHSPPSPVHGRTSSSERMAQFRADTKCTSAGALAQRGDGGRRAQCLERRRDGRAARISRSPSQGHDGYVGSCRGGARPTRICCARQAPCEQGAGGGPSLCRQRRPSCQAAGEAGCVHPRFSAMWLRRNRGGGHARIEW